jgi:hypothetical protein
MDGRRRKSTYEPSTVRLTRWRSNRSRTRWSACNCGERACTRGFGRSPAVIVAANSTRTCGDERILASSRNDEQSNGFRSRLRGGGMLSRASARAPTTTISIRKSGMVFSFYRSFLLSLCFLYLLSPPVSFQQSRGRKGRGEVKTDRTHATATAAYNVLQSSGTPGLRPRGRSRT